MQSINTVSELAKALEPRLSRSRGSGVGGGSSTVQHALSSATHTGTLGNNQAPQFLLLNGSRPMQGPLNLGTYNITNVGLINGIDITNIATEASGRIIEGDGINISGSGYITNTPVISVDFDTLANSIAGDGLENVDGELSVDIGPGFDFDNDGQLILASTIGGGGLVYDTVNGEINVFAGLGLEIAGNGSVKIDFDGIAGNGLGYGSNYLQVNAGTHISTASDDVSVTVSTMAGAGLGVSGDTLIVNAGDAIEIVSDAVRVKASDLVGGGLNAVGNNLEVRTGFTTEISSNNLEVDTAFDFPWTGTHTHADNLASLGAVSGVTGWTLFPNGNADFRDIQADSLTVDAFIADVNLALAGSEYITKSGATVAETFTTPTTTGTLTVFDHLADTQVFEAGDSVALRYINRGTGLEVGWVHGLVTNYTDLADGKQSWTFTRVSGAIGVEIPAGVWAVGYGTSGDGVIKSTVNDLESPYIDIQVWTGVAHLPGSFETKVRLGKLDGITDTYLNPSGYGLYAGNVFLHGAMVLGNGGEVRLDEGGLSMGGYYQADYLPNTAEKITWYTDNDDRQYKNAVSIIEGHRNTLIVNSTPIQTNFTKARSNAGYIGGESTGADIAAISIDATWYDSGGSSHLNDQSYLRLYGKEADSEAYLRAETVILGGLYSGGGSTVIVDGTVLRSSGGADLGTSEYPWQRLYVDELIAGTVSSVDTGHNHDDRYYTETEIDSTLSGYALSSHSHAGYATVTYVDDELDGKSDTGHTHDSRYYTESEVDGLIANLASNSHAHGDIYYTETEVDALLDAKSDSDHTHDFSTVEDHSDLANIGPDDHHNQAHALDSSDHTGTLSWSKVNKTGAVLGDLGGTLAWDDLSKSGSDLNDISGTLAWGKVSKSGAVLGDLGGTLAWASLNKTSSALSDIVSRPHSSLTSIGTDDHHAKQHALSDTDHHTGEIANSQATQFFLLDGTRNITGHLLNDGGEDNNIGSEQNPWNELHVLDIVASRLVPVDIAASIDGRILVPSASGKLTRDVADDDTTIYIDVGTFSSGDYAYLQTIYNSTPQYEVVQFQSDATTIDANVEYSYTVTRNVDQRADGAVVSSLENEGVNSFINIGFGFNTSSYEFVDISWRAGDGIVSLGSEAGDGFIDIYADTSLSGSYGPTISINSRSSGSTWNAISEVVAVGNLQGRLDYFDPTFGFAVGDDLNKPIESFRGLTATSNGMRLLNTPLSYYSTTDGVKLGAFFGSSGSEPLFKIGENASSLDGDPFVGNGLWAGTAGGSFATYIGDSTGSYLEAKDGDLTVYGSLQSDGAILASTGVQMGAEKPIDFAADNDDVTLKIYRDEIGSTTGEEWWLTLETNYDDDIADDDGESNPSDGPYAGIALQATADNLNTYNTTDRQRLEISPAATLLEGHLIIRRIDTTLHAGLSISAFEETAPAIDIGNGQLEVYGGRLRTAIELAPVDIAPGGAFNTPAGGTYISIGHNANSARPAPGHIRMYNANGKPFYLWVDSNEELRFGTTRPTGNTEFTGAVIS